MIAALAFAAALVLAPGTPDPPPGITGAASPLLAGLCVKQARPAAEGKAILRCAGLVGTDVFLRGGEDARSLAFGNPAGFLVPPSGASSLGRSIRWRILGARPIAGIVRYTFASQAAGAAGIMVLAIVKPGTTERPGCLVGLVEDGQGASALAEATADGRAVAFRCGVDRPGLDGPVSTEGGPLIRSWLAAQPRAR